MRVGVIPGSFDPITVGHLDVIKRALVIVDKVIVLVASNPRKKYIFSGDERVDLIREAMALFGINSRVEIEKFDGLLADFMGDNKYQILIKGIRNQIDYEYESAMANINNNLNSSLETIFIVSRPEHSIISSSMLKEITPHLKDEELTKYTTINVVKSLKERIK